MKKVILVMAVAFATLTTTFAQTEAGNLLLSGQSSLGFSAMSTQLKYDGEDVGDASKTTSLSLGLSMGYFVIDNLAVGASLPISYTKLKDYGSETTIGFAPFARYYFGSGAIKPFVNAEIGFVSSKSKPEDGDESTQSGLITSGGAGVAFFVNKNVSIDALLDYNYASMKDGDDDKAVMATSGVMFNVGVSVFF